MHRLLAVSLAAMLACSACNRSGSSPGTPALSVVSVEPAGGIGSVGVESAITATFSDTLDAATVDLSSVVADANGFSLSGDVTASGMMVLFTPRSDLPYDSVVTVSIKKSVAGESGESLDSDFTWSFTTEPFRGDYVLVSESYGNSIAKIDPATDTVVSRVVVGENPQFIAADQDRRIAYTSLYADGAIAAIRPDTMEAAVLDIPGLGSQPIGIALSSDGKTLLVATRGSDAEISGDDRLDIVSLDPSVWPPSAVLTQSVATGRNPITACIDHSGRYAVITVRDEPAVLFLDMTNFTIVGELDGLAGESEPEGCDLHPTEHLAYITLHGSNSLLVIDFMNLQRIRDLPLVSSSGGAPGPSTVQFSPGGTRAFVQAQTTNEVLMLDTTNPRSPFQETDVQLSVGLQPHFIVWLPEDRAYVANTGDYATNGSVSLLLNYSGTPEVGGPVLTDLQGPLSFSYFTAQ